MKQDDIEDIYELSALQQGMLFHDVYNPGSRVYFVQLVARLRLDLDHQAFDRAWQTVVERHTALRTSFHWEEVDKPLQVVHRQAKPTIERHDWRDLPASGRQKRLEELLARDRHLGFSLSEAPLLRLALCRLGNGDYQLVWSYHHLLADGWSVALVLKELFALYNALLIGSEALLPPARRYGDYIQWLHQQDTAAAEAFWRAELAGLTAPTPLSMMPGGAPSATVEARYHSLPVRIDAETTAGLRALARRNHLTLNTLVQGAWALLLARYSGEREVVFGATVSGRSAALSGIESMVGLFMNTLPVRAAVPPDAYLSGWLTEQQSRQAGARDYEHSSLIDLQRWSGLPSGQPLFYTLVVFERYPAEEALAGIVEREVDSSRRLGADFVGADFSASLCVAETPEGLTGSLSYSVGLHDRNSVLRLLGQLKTLLSGIAAPLDIRLWELPLLTTAERWQLLGEQNDTGRGWPPGCLHHLFEEQAARTPDAIAVTDGTVRLTYRELNVQAARLTQQLRRMGIGPEQLVALCAERTVDLLAALLGILKAGAAYLPLDPSYPQERLRFLLEDAGAGVLVTQERLLAMLPEHRAQLVILEDVAASEVSPQEDPEMQVGPRNLSHVLYTSGSTGRPKAVAIEHASAVAFLRWAGEVFTREELAGVLATTSINFDCTLFELFAPLSWGGKVVLARSVLELPVLSADDEVTLISMVPSALLQHLRADALPPSVRAINVGGETSPHELIEELERRRDTLRVFHVYGPTEDTTYSTYCILREASGGSLSIGRPITGTAVYILDPNGGPAPIGVPGEIYLGGDGLARGYLGRPELTAERFLPDPWSGRPGARLYRTGDLARFRPDGESELLGRIDQQVKIRGFRVELGEVEVVLQQYPRVSEAAALLFQKSGGEGRLVAYCVARPGNTLSAADLRKFARERLPAPMVPSAFVVMSALPRLFNGKLNRRALPEPDWGPLGSESTFVAPRDTWELELTRIWEDLLGIVPIGVRDDFFALGGHSLHAVSFSSRVQRELGRRIPLSALFGDPTIEDLASLLRHDAAGEPPPSLVAIERRGGPGLPIFWMHPGRGSVFCYYELARSLGSERPIYGLQARGLDTEGTAVATIEEMAALYLDEVRALAPEGPYILGGWCMGGLVAMEMAQQIRQEGREVAFLALLDSWAPDGSAVADDLSFLADFAEHLDLQWSGDPPSREDLLRLPPDQWLGEVLEQAKAAGSIPRGFDLLHGRLLFDLFKMNCRAEHAYIPRPYSGRVHLFGAADSLRESTEDLTLGWRRWGLEQIEVHEVPGNHHTMLRAPYVDTLAERLRTLLPAP